MPMGNVAVRRIGLVPGLGKVAIIEADFDASYDNTNGELLDLTAFDPDVDFTTVHAISTLMIYTTGADPTFPVETLVCKVFIEPGAAQPAGTGFGTQIRCRAFAEDGTSGVTTQVANTTDLSTVRCRFLVIGE